MQLARLMLLVTALGVACQSSSGPPQGTQVFLTPGDTAMLVARAKLENRSYAAAISAENAAYVSQSDLSTVLRIDLASHSVTERVTVGDTPTEMAFNSTGTRLYVTNQYSSSVSVINVGTNEVIETIPVGNRPFEVIVEPGDSILWVGKIDSLYGVRLATGEIIARFQIGDVGNGVAIARDL